MAKAAIVAALMATLACGSAALSTGVRGGGSWQDLFQPPYTTAPSIMMAITCVAETACYVPGGENGVGFRVFKFDGAPNGVFTPLTMEGSALMLMAISFGGSPSKPHGAVGGISFGAGLDYPVNATCLKASKVDSFFVVTQDIEASASGEDVIVVDDATANAVLHSADGGASFVEKKINVKLVANCTGARYGAIASPSTWYVTLGSWPNENSKKDTIQKSARVYYGRDRKTGAIRRHSRNMLKSKMNVEDEGFSSSSNNEYSIYTAQIVKTTDGGATFTTLFAEATNFYFNDIVCTDVNTCFAVGEGFNSDPAAYIYGTTDGKTWTMLHKEPSTSTASNSLMSIRAANGVVIAAGGAQSEFGGNSLILESIDNGKTWTKMNSLPHIVDISDLDMLSSGIAFATAMTAYDDSTIIKYTPGNVPPTPPGPPAPTQGFFVQKQCSDSNCSIGCRTLQFPVNNCIPTSGGGSATVQCTPGFLVQTDYQNSGCTGPSQISKEPLNKCLQSGSGGYFENICPNEIAFDVPAGNKFMRA